ncbi:Phospholipid-lipopolysaccharide ABC transporter [Candidatus Synechococcus spongiarum]|uniref:Phospholipid-lipopolysaccharide ABC transporter n=1 Tax=Candidatus Synechococcus spongiarum TaxID=431041 RepID=A0A165AFE2_9SYNE|nr:Phospholipid-lipopolysaccharide ABC transporter [Candidatus Synechococcus spongiarum]
MEQLLQLLKTLPRRRCRSLLLLLALSGVTGLMDLVTVVLLARLTAALVDVPLPNQLPGIKVFGGSLYDQTLWLVGLFTLLAWLASLSKLGLQVSQQKLAAHIWHDLSAQIYANVMGQELTYHLKARTGDLTQLVIENVKANAVQVVYPLLRLVGACLTLVFISIGVLVVGRGLAAGLVILLVAAYLSVSLIFTPYLRRANQKTVQLAQRSTCLLMESLGSVRDIQLAQQEPYFQHRFVQAVDEARRYAWQLDTLPQLPRLLVEPLGITLIFGLGTLPPLLRGDLEQVRQVIPFLAALALAGLRLMPPLQDVFSSLIQLRGGLPVVHKVVELLQLPRRRLTLTSPDVPPPSAVFPQHTIGLRDVWYGYGEPEDSSEWVLRQLTLTIPVGSRVALVGSTGSGKTTAGHVLLALLQPQRGSLELDGQPLSEQQRPAWQVSCAHVPQLIQLLDGTMEQNVAFGVEQEAIDHHRVQEAVAAAQLAELVASLPSGLQTPVGQNGIRLSGGQRQRIALARAFYRRARFLLLDEATSALDNRTESGVIQALDQVGRHCTTVIIAHRLATVARCDRIHELANGCVKASGRFEELRRASSSFAELVRLDRL